MELCCLIDAVCNAWLLLPIFGIAVISYKLCPINKSIKGKHILITGGSSGIGLAVASNAVKRGAKVTIIARNLNNLQKAKTDLDKLNVDTSASSQIQTFSLDLNSGVSKINQTVHEAEGSFGPIYMLVNCAGFAKAAKFEEINENDIQTMLNVNLVGSFLITQSAVRSMKRAGEGGVIVFTSSQGGLLGLYGYTAYAAAKGAIVKMAEALHMEMKPYNISVTVSFPPDTDTPGFVEENKTKPNETSLISAAAGIFQPDVVADKLMNDSLCGKFMSTVGLEGFMLTTLCAGMGPITHFSDFVFQVFLSGLFRSVSAFYLWSFSNIVNQEYKKRLESKKKE